MLILNGYCGIGGNRKLWGNKNKIIAIENNPRIAKIYKDFFTQDEVIVTDAHQYLLDNYKKFDFIFMSPPCPTHSRIRKCGVKSGKCKMKYPDMNLYQEIILLQELGPRNLKYCIENVKPYYKPLINAQECGRHLFWSNFYINQLNIVKCNNFTRCHKKELMKWLDIYIDKNIYLSNNHDERQILRNCVHPKLGLHIFNCAFRNVQLEMF